MKLALLSEGSDTLDLLMEANVFNNTETHNGTSIKAFAEFYGDMLDSNQNKKAFVKKITKLLINDPKYHFAMREVPPEAPQWAHEAHSRQELVYFEPDTNLKQKMEHLTHWINALEHDAKQKQDKDKKAFATRELQGFGKAESIDVLEQKSNKYFARGSKKAQGDVSGLEPRLDAGNGFVWYEIVEASALGREGKVLQNCIGTHYTASKLAANGQKIYVLKNPQGETVVAIRTSERNKTIEEIKGKQNRPPVEKYMPPVQKFVKKSKMGMSTWGKNDLENAGYFWIDNQVWTKADAIKEFLQAEHKAKLGYGLDLFVIYARPSAQDILKSAYNIRRYDNNNYNIAEVRRDGHPVMSAVIDQNGDVLKDIINHAELQKLSESVLVEAANDSKLGRDSIEFVQTLLDRGMVKDVGSEIQKTMFWKNHLKYDRDQKKVSPRSEGLNHVDMKKGSPVKRWEVHSKPSEVLNVMNSVASSNNWSKKQVEHMKAVFGSETDIDKIYLADAGKGEWVMVVVDKHQQGHPHDIIIQNKDVELGAATRFAGDHAAYGEANINTDPNKVKAVIDLANHHGFSLPNDFNMQHNVQRGHGGQHEQIELKPVTVGKKVPAQFWDFSSLSKEDQLQGVYHLYHKLGGRMSIDARGKADNKYSIEDHFGGKNSEASTWHDHQPRGAHNPIHNGGYRGANKVYTFNVKYANGSKDHEVLVFAKDNKIVRIDDKTDRHGWQAWSDSEDVAGQLNTFADEQGLKVGRDALRGKRELRASARDNTFRTAEEAAAINIKNQRDRGQLGKEGTDVIHFEDDYKFERMDPVENGKMLRQMMGNPRGELWKIVRPDGENWANILVGRGGKVKGIYRSSWDTMKPSMRDKNADEATADQIATMKKPVRMSDHPAIYGHLKTAAEKLGWTIDLQDRKQIEKEEKTRWGKNRTKHYNLLRTLRNEHDPMPRSLLWQEAENRKAPSAHASTATDINYLEKQGLVNITRTQAGRRGDWSRHWLIEITPAGKAFYDKLHRDGKAHPVDVASPKATHKDWSEPTAKDKAKGKTKTKKKATSSGTNPLTRARRGGATKAQQALDLYTQMVDDNDGEHPARQEFIRAMQDEPFNMSASGAATYHYNTKKKYNAQQDVTEALLQSLGGLKRLIVG